MSNKIPGTWTAVPDQLLGIDFDIYEIVIISSIQSWTRQNKTFYESITRLSNEYKCDRKTFSRRFKKLIDLGILLKGKKRGHGQFEYQVNEKRLIDIIKQRNACTSEVQPDVNDVPERSNSYTPEVQNKTTKTSNKTSFREGEDKESSLPNPKELEAWMETLDMTIK